MLRRDIRYQAALLRDHHLLLLKVFERADNTEFWIIPGGGREPGESEAECLRRELREEAHLEIAVGRLLFETPAIAEDMYQRSRTYLCTIVAGEARPGSEPELDHDGQASIRALGWFDLRNPAGWSPEVATAKATLPLLHQLRLALGYAEPKPAQWAPEHGSVFSELDVAAAYEYRPPYPPAAIEALVGLLAPAVPARVLDAGCGTGFVARPLAPLVAQIDAVDISEPMLAVGQSSSGGAHPHIRWLCSAMESFAAEPPYALIVAGSSLHWMDWFAVLPRFAQWLAPGGVLALLSEQHEPSPWGAEAGQVITRYSTNRDFRPYNLGTIVDELSQRGLFQQSGARSIPAAPFVQPVADYLESLHARNGLARSRMGATAQALDSELTAVLAPYCPDGMVRLRVGAELRWGMPAPFAPF